jgi:hypothetical protein
LELRLGSDALAHLEAIEFTRHHDVKQHQVRLGCLHLVKPGLPVGRLDDVVSVRLQRPAKQAPDVGMVLDDQDSSHVSHLGFGSRPAPLDDERNRARRCGVRQERVRVTLT